MFITIHIFVFLLSLVSSHSLQGSSCLRMTRETFTLRGKNIMPDLSEFASQAYQINVDREGFNRLEVRMKIITSLMKFLPSFAFFYLRINQYDDLDVSVNEPNYFRKENPFAGIFNSTAFGSKNLAHISGFGFGESKNTAVANNSDVLEPWSQLGKDLSAKTLTNPLETVVYHEDASISQVLKEMEYAKNAKIFGHLPKLGMVSPLVTAGNESICRNESLADEDELLKLLNQVFIGPFHCQNESSVEECVEEVVQAVEDCGAQVKAKMSKLNHSEFLPLGILTSTTSFRDDYLGRGKYWCLISEYAEKTGRQVIVLDEDGFIYNYSEGSLKWATSGNSTSFEDEARNILTTPAFISGAVVVLSIILFVLFLLHSVQSRRNHKRQLSKNDASEFFNGKSNQSGWLGLSYNRDLEILKDDIYLDIIIINKDATSVENISRRESTCVEKSGNSNDENKLLVRFSREICSGLEYLAGKKVIHGDLATRNVLLSSSLKAKISDFGLSRRLYEYTKYVKKEEEPIPWKWMAPEALTKLEFSEQSDVWSYGVTIWEIFSFGSTPYPGLGWRIDFPNELEKGLRLDIPEACPQHFYETMQMCWCINPSERPTFSQLKERIG